jgi:hypothetical protein
MEFAKAEAEANPVKKLELYFAEFIESVAKAT